MTSSTRIRFAALAAGATVVAAGFFAAAPANAATGTITLANTTFTAGSWGTGLDVTGAGFTAASNVTITVTDSVAGVLDTHVVGTPVDAAGTFADAFTPAAALPELVPGETITVSATSDQKDDSNSVALTVASVLAPKGITASATTITTADLVDETIGVWIHAAGYTPGEEVYATVAYGGTTEKVGPYMAAADGSVEFGLFLGAGLASAGTMTITVVGSDSAASQSIDIQVTGEDILVGDDADAVPVVDDKAPTASSATTPGSKLPVVSG